jgi:hypothetical protein
MKRPRSKLTPKGEQIWRFLCTTTDYRLVQFFELVDELVDDLMTIQNMFDTEESIDSRVLTVRAFVKACLDDDPND